MKNVVLLLILIAVFASCSPRLTEAQWKRKYPVPKPDTVTQIQEKTVYRDTTIFHKVDADTVWKVDSIFVDKKTGLINYPLQRLDVEFAFSTIEIINGRISHKLFQRDLLLQHTIEKAIKEAETVKTETVTEPYPVYFEPTFFQQLLMKLGWAFIFAIIGYAAAKVWKFKKPF